MDNKGFLREKERLKAALLIVMKLPLANFFKLVFAYAAIWANPVIGQVFKGRAGGNAVFRVTNLGVINVTASDAFVLVHVSP